jgi:hypothetical protein
MWIKYANVINVGWRVILSELCHPAGGHPLGELK